MEHLKDGSESPKGVGSGLSLPPGPNGDPPPSRDYSPTRSISDRMQLGNINLRNSEEEVVKVYGLVQLLGSIPRNRPLKKSDEDGRGYLDG